MRLPFLFFAAIVFILSSCIGKNKPANDIPHQTAASTAKNLVISVSPSGNSYTQGETVSISYEPATEYTPLDSAVLYISGKQISKMDGTSHEYKTDSKHRVGRTTYRVEGFKNGESSTKSGEFTLKPSSEPVIYGYRIINTYPHDDAAYTQGLYWHEGFMYEGTGMNGASSLRKVELSTGKVIQKTDIDKQYFGEGIALLDNKIYQLTWQSRKGFIYDAGTFEKLGEFGYNSEGWGLTTDGKALYMSDGSEKIYVVNPEGFRTMHTLQVYGSTDKVININEMEWIEGEIWANVYMTNYIVRINPETGALKGVVDLTGLMRNINITPDTDVLNGIAYDEKTKRIFLTGKNWNKLFQIEVLKK